RVGPVFKEQAATIHEPVEPRAVVGSEAAPQRQIVRAIEHVDRVELHAAHVLDESAKPRRGEWACPRPRQVLPLEEERGDGVQRNGSQRALPSAPRALPIHTSLICAPPSPSIAARSVTYSCSVAWMISCLASIVHPRVSGVRRLLTCQGHREA